MIRADIARSTLGAHQGDVVIRHIGSLSSRKTGVDCGQQNVAIIFGDNQRG